MCRLCPVLFVCKAKCFHRKGILMLRHLVTCQLLDCLSIFCIKGACKESYLSQAYVCVCAYARACATTVVVTDAVGTDTSFVVICCYT